MQTTNLLPIDHHCLQGIAVKMITGDHLLIGKETARMLGMGTMVCGGAILWRGLCIICGFETRAVAHTA